jgi:RHS repeat-associated protein
MISKVIEQRGMSFTASSLNEQGTVTPGSMTRQEVYGYQFTNLTDAPTYISMTETWTRDGVNTDQAVTSYETHPNSTPRTVTVTLPNGTKSIQYSHNAPGQYNDGLVYLDETRAANNTLLQSSTATWQQGAYDSPRPTRVEATDERGQMTASEFSYGSVYNQVTEARNYDYGGQTLLRATRTQYETSASYTNRHIFNLVKAIEVYASDNITRVSRTEYQYDGQTLSNTPGVVMHDNASNPYAPQIWIPPHCRCEEQQNESSPCTEVCDPGYYASAYDTETDFRGLVTQVKTFSNAATEPASGAITETRSYDINGNLVTASTSCCQQMSINYTQATQYAYPSSQTRGSSDPNSSVQVATSATYDFNTGLGLTGTDPNGRVSQATYFAETLRPQTAYSPTGAYVSYAYDEAAMSVTDTTYAADGAIADQNVKLLNGRGQVRREKALGINNVWDMVDTQYDALGRVTQQSLPYRSGDTIQWSTTTYDALGRTISSQAPDGSTTQAFYNEVNRPDVATSAPGQTTRIVDAWNRERWGRTDSSGRLVEVVEPNPNGNGSVTSGGLLTAYGYDTLDNLTTVTQGAQSRSFRYDSLGRMTHQKLAEASATLNDAGQYVATGGTWSDVFTYDERSNVTSRKDARGVKTVFSYNNDPLNRLQSISFDTTGFGDTTHPIAAAPAISYAYMTTGDLTRPSAMTTAGVSTEAFSYDSEGRISTRTLTLTSRPSYPMVTDYTYDSLNRETDVLYPAEYGTGAAPRKVVHHDYDIASRLSGLKVDGADYASQVVYNAASQTTSLKVGASGANQITENYSYHAPTGLLENQTVTRGASVLLDLSYNYAGANGKRTGQLTGITNNADASRGKDRNYEYDALGRLAKATGGIAASPLWTQDYDYDRYGNRTSVTATGTSGGTTLSAPTNLATPTVSNNQVVLQWGASSGAHHYQIESRDNVAEEYQVTGTSTTPTYTDNSVGAGKAYLYRVRAVDASGNLSAPSNVRLATTVTFTDVPATGGVTLIKAQHVTELRQAINAVRATANSPAATWTDASLSGVAIKAVHFEELRSKLNEALQSLSFTGPTYTDAQLEGVAVKRVHLEELRQAVNWGGTGGGGGGGGVPTPIPRDGLSTLTYNGTSNRITSAGYEYDAAGNLTRSQTASGAWQRYGYDAAGRLINVKTDANALISSYSYGSSNQRLTTTEGGLKTYYAWAGEAVVAEYIEGDTAAVVWSKSYVYLGARLLATLQPNGSGGEATQFHHPDRLGTRLISNASDANVQEQVTLPFGTALGAESTGASNRRFTSYDRSATTGLDYAINRHYDSQQGRFTQVDPIGAGATDLNDPQSLNLYAYCGNDPVNYTDPSGLFFKKLFSFLAKAFKWIAIVITVAVAVLTIASGFGVPGAAAILKGLNAVLGAIGSALNTATGGLLGKISGVLDKVLGSLGLPFVEVGGVSAAGMGLTALRIAGGIGSVANHMQRRRRGDRRRRRPGDYQTITAAAIAALQLYNIASILANREFNGSICEYPNGRIIYTPPNIGTASSSSPSPCPAGTTRVGTYHTHAAHDPSLVNQYGDGNEAFSVPDRINANNRSLASGNSVPNFVGTPSGAIRRFDPAAIPNSIRGRVTTLKPRTPIP